MSALNLSAVSGPNEFSTALGIGGSDFKRSAGWAVVGDAMRDFAIATCTPSLSLNKITVPHDFDVDTELVFDGDGAPVVARGVAAGGWEFDVVPGPDAQFTVVGENPFVTADGGSVNIPLVIRDGATTVTYYPITVTERLQDGWEIVEQEGRNATCLYQTVGTDRKSSVPGMVATVSDAGPGASFGMLAQSMVTCWFINREPRPLEAKVSVGGTFDRDWRWEVDKAFDGDAFAGDVIDGAIWTRPDTPVTLPYTLTVRALPHGDGNFVASGTVELTNSSGRTWTVGDAIIRVNGVAVTPLGVGDGQIRAEEPVPAGTPILPGESVTVGWVYDFGGTRPGTVRVTVDTVGLLQGGAATPSDFTFGQVPARQTNTTATLTDLFDTGTLQRFPELTDHFDATELSVVGYPTTAQVWNFDYEVTIDGLTPGESTILINTARVVWDNPGVPSGDRDHGYVPGVDEATVEVQVNAGQDLSVSGTLSGRAQRSFGWEVDKYVWDATLGDGGWAATATLPQDPQTGTAEFTYRVVVTRSPFTDGDWQLAVEGVQVTNPNPFPVAATVAATVTQLGWSSPITPVDVQVGPGETVDVSLAGQVALIGGNTFLVDLQVVWDAEAAFSPSGSATQTSTSWDDGWEWIFFSVANREVLVADDLTGEALQGLATIDHTAGLIATGASSVTITTPYITAVTSPFGWDTPAATAVDGAQTVTLEYTLTLDGPWPGLVVEHPNRAVILAGDGDLVTGEAIDEDTALAIVTREGAPLAVALSVEAAFEQRLGWGIDKQVLDPSSGQWVDAVEVDALGEPATATADFRVAVTAEELVEYGWRLDGAVAVVNPNPFEVEVTLAELGFVDVVALVDPVTGEPITGSVVTVPAAAGVAGQKVLPFTGDPADLAALDARPTGEVSVAIGWDETVTGTSGIAVAGDVVGIEWSHQEIHELANYTIVVFDDMTDPAHPVFLGATTWSAVRDLPEHTWVEQYELTLDAPAQAGAEDHRNVAWVQAVPGDVAPADPETGEVLDPQDWDESPVEPDVDDALDSDDAQVRVYLTLLSVFKTVEELDVELFDPEAHEASVVVPHELVNSRRAHPDEWHGAVLNLDTGELVGERGKDESSEVTHIPVTPDAVHAVGQQQPDHLAKYALWADGDTGAAAQRLHDLLPEGAWDLGSTRTFLADMEGNPIAVDEDGNVVLLDEIEYQPEALEGVFTVPRGQHVVVEKIS